MTSKLSNTTLRALACGALVVGSLGCAHTRERTTVSAVTNAQASGDPSEPSRHKMHYTEVHGDQQRPSPGDESAANPEGYALTGEKDLAGQCELSVFFADKSAVLDAEAKRRLGLVAGCLKRKEVDHATVAGYADPRGTKPDNLELSERRAEAAARFLEQQGVPRSEIRVVGAGEMGAQDAPQLWPKERRSEVHVAQ